MDVLADIGYQSNWLDILNADFMRNALIGGCWWPSPPACSATS